IMMRLARGAYKFFEGPAGLFCGKAIETELYE
ncbi:unnamed protein product, partial [marine sediment metagenome]